MEVAFRRGRSEENVACKESAALRAHLPGIRQSTRRLLLGAVVLTLALVSVGAARATGTMPSPQPLWNAYPLNAGQSHTQLFSGHRTRSATPHRSGGSTGSVELAAVLGGIVAAGAAFFVYLRTRRQRSVGPAPYPLPDPERPPPQMPVSRRPILRSRAREVVRDLLETLDTDKGRSAPPQSDEELLLVLCERIRSATLAGDVAWFRAAAGEFLWERAVGSLAIRTSNGDSPPYELVVSEWDGVKLDVVRSPLPSRPDGAAPADALGGVYDAARESASRIYEPIDTLIDALRGPARRA